MAEEFKVFKVLISTELNEGSIDNLKSQISNIKTNPIKIKLDTTSINSQIDKIKRQIESLNNIRINLGAGTSGYINNSNSIDRYTSDLQKSYRNLYSISKQISSMELKVGKLNISGVNKNEISKYISDLDKLKQTYSTLMELLNSNGANTNFSSLASSIDQAKTKLSELSASVDNTKTRLASNIKLKIDNGTLNNQLAAVESKFKNLGVSSNAVYSQIQQLKSLLGSMDASDNIESVISDYQNFQQILKTTENNVKGLQRVQAEQTAAVNQTANSFGNLARQAASYFSAWQMINYSIRGLKDMYQNVLDIDTAMTELVKVTNETDETYNKFLSDAADKAKEIGTSISNYINSSANFARLGYTFDQSQNLSKVANIYDVVGDEISGIEEATSSVISTMKAFDVEADDSISIVDKFNEVSNNFAISSGGIGEAMTRSASSMALANNTIDETISLITAANSVVQDPVKVGNAVKTISMRLRAAKTELEESGEDTEGMAESVASLRNEIIALSGVDIMIDDNTFKSTYQIIDELSTKWQNLTDIQRASITDLVAGKNHGNVLSSLVSNFNVARQALETSLNSEGSAIKEHEKWMQSLQGHLNQLGSSWEALSVDFLDSDFLKGLIDGITSAIDKADSLVNTFGAIPTLAGTIAAALSFKNIGFSKIVTDTDTFVSKLNLMNQTIVTSSSHFRNLGTAITTTFSNIGNTITSSLSSLVNGFKTGGLKGGFSNIFSGIKIGSAKGLNRILTGLISQADIDAINSYNAALADGMSMNDAMASSMANASNAAKQVAVSANGSAVSMNVLGTAMAGARLKAIGLQIAATALNVALTVGLSVAITSVVSAISNWINKEEEARKTALEAGEAAKEESDSIKNLYDAYNNAKELYESNQGSKEDLDKAARNLAASLGIESTEIDNLTKKYGDLDTAIKEVYNDVQSNNLADIMSARKAAGDELSQSAKGKKWWQFWKTNNIQSFSFKNNSKDLNEEIKTALVNAGFDETKTTQSLVTGKIDLEFNGDINNADDVVEMYRELLKRKDALIKGTEDGLYSMDDLTDSGYYKSIEAMISKMEESYNQYVRYIKDQNKEIANIEFGKLYKGKDVVKTQEDFNKLKDSLVDAVKNNKDFTGSEEEAEEAVLDMLSCVADLSSFMQEYAEAVAASTDKSIEIWNAFESIKKRSDSTVKSVTALNEALSSGGSISYDDAYSAELFEYQSALENVNGIMQLNADKARELAEAKVKEQIAANEATKAHRQTEYAQNAKEIENLRQKLESCTDANSEQAEEIRSTINELICENGVIENTCAGIDLLNSSLRESISAYSEWKNAQNTAESGDMFDDTLTAIQTINDTLNNTESELYQRIGREGFKTSVGLIIPDTVDPEDEKAVNDYLDSINDLFTFDDNGNRNGLNLKNFCQKAVDEGLMVLNKATNEYEIAGEKTMEEFADGLNLSLPMVQAVFGEIEEFGAEFEWVDSFDTFGDGILLASQELTTLQNELNNLETRKSEGIDIDDSRIEETKEKIKELLDYKEKLTKKSSVNIDANMKLDEQIAEVKNEIKGFKAVINDEISTQAEIKVATDGLGKAKSELSDLKKEKAKLQEPTEFEVRLKLDKYEEKKKELEDYLNSLENEEYVAKVGLNTEQVDQETADTNDKIKKIEKKEAKIKGHFDIQEIENNIETVDEELNNLDKTTATPDITADASVFESKYKQVIEKLEDLNKRTATVTITTTEKKETIIDKAVNTLKGKNKVNGTAHISGTAKVSGTAKASGDWGNKEPGKTLVGELGPEILLDTRTGRWHTVGDNGAEFVNVPKDAIVFNHLQTKDLLSKGFVASRGLAMASGTALASGNALALGSGSKAKTVKGLSADVVENVYIVSNTTPPSSKNPSTNSSSNSSSKNSTDSKKSKKNQEETIENLDWIERLIASIEHGITKLKNAAEATWDSWSSRNRSLNKELSAIGKEIGVQEKALKTYNNEASNVKLDRKYKDLVDNGALDIQKIKDDDLKQKIDEYQTWSDKVRETELAIDSLRKTENELIKQRFNNTIKKQDSKVEYRDSKQQYRDTKFNGKLERGIVSNKTIDKYYNTRDKGLQKNIKDSKNEAKSLENQLSEAVKSGAIKKGSQDWYELKTQIQNAKNQQAEWEEQIKNSKINKANTKLDQMNKTLDKYNIKAEYAISQGNYSRASKYYKMSIKSLTKYASTMKAAGQSLDEIKSKLDEYIDKLDEARQAKLDAKLGEIDADISLSNATTANTVNAKNNQIKFQNKKLDEKNEAYKESVSTAKSNSKELGEIGKKSITKKLNTKAAKNNKKYKQALKRAKNAINAKKKVSDSDLKIIKTKSNDTYLKLYAYNESIDDLENAKEEEALGYASNIAEKYSNTSQFYDNKNDNLDKQSDLQRKKSSNAIGASAKNEQLEKVASNIDEQLANDDAKIETFSKIADQASAKITTKNALVKGFSKFDDKIKDKVKDVIRDAKKYVKSGKSISDNTINSIEEYYEEGYITESFYKACIKYNEAIENKELAEEQRNVDFEDAKTEKAALGKEIFDNIEQDYTNKKNAVDSTRNKVAVNQSIRSTKGFDLTPDDYKELKSYSEQKTQLIHDELEEQEKTIAKNIANGKWEDGSQEHIDALQRLEDLRDEYNQCMLEQEEWNVKTAEYPYTIFDRAISFLQGVRSNLQSLLSIKTTRGVSKTEDDIIAEIHNVNNEIAEQTAKREKLWEDYETAARNGGAYGGKTAEEWLAEYYETDTQINNLEADVEELNNEMAQLPYDRYEKVLSLLDSIAAENKSINELTKAQGLDLSEDNYLTEIKDNNKKLEQYQNERFQAYVDYQKSLASDDLAYGGKTADQWKAQYNELSTTINNLKSENETIKDALRDDVYWRTFERSHKAAQALKDILSGIADLINDDMLYDKNGNFTDYGIAQISNIVKQYETARKEVQNYTNDIQNLNSLYAQGYYNQDEFNEKLNELQNGLLDAASSMKSYISEIIDMNKKLAQSELDALFKLIDARNEALSAKKACTITCFLC